MQILVIEDEKITMPSHQGPEPKTGIMALGIFLPFSGFADALKMVPLPLSYFPWLFAILLVYCILTQLVKVWFIRKFHEWL